MLLRVGKKASKEFPASSGIISAPWGAIQAKTIAIRMTSSTIEFCGIHLISLHPETCSVVVPVKVKNLKWIAVYMQQRDNWHLVALLALLLLGFTSLMIGKSAAFEGQDIPFEVIDHGDISGYLEETYLAAKTESEWAEIWKNHTAPITTESRCPTIDFSKNMVICSFMGKRPTSGYSMSIGRIWAEGQTVHVKIVKHCPSNDSVVCQVITQPYMFALLEKTESEVVFEVEEETETNDSTPAPEFPTATLALAGFAIATALTAILTRKQKHYCISAK